MPVIRVRWNYYLADDAAELSKILRKLKEISPDVFDGRVEFHDFGLYSLRIWEITNRWVLDEEVKGQKTQGEEFLDNIQGIPPVGIIHGSFDDFPELGDPDIVVERDPDGEYGVEVFIDKNSVKVLSYECDITSGIGEWTIETYHIAEVE